MEKNVIAQFMRARINRLFHSKAALAQLRSGIGKEIGESPGLLGFVLPPTELITWEKDKETITWKKGEEMAEKAIYTALTLYAFHQQGSNVCMSAGLDENESAVSYKNSFGNAIRKLVSKNSQNELAIKRRFDKVLTAKDTREVAVHARGLIGILKKEGITLDYPGFTEDLYWFQQQDSRRAVLLKWGKDYYMSKGSKD